MHFVKDVHLVPSWRTKRGRGNDVANIVNAVITGSVKFNHIKTISLLNRKT